MLMGTNVNTFKWQAYALLFWKLALIMFYWHLLCKTNRILIVNIYMSHTDSLETCSCLRNVRTWGKIQGKHHVFSFSWRKLCNRISGCILTFSNRLIMSSCEFLSSITITELLCCSGSLYPTISKYHIYYPPPP